MGCTWSQWLQFGERGVCLVYLVPSSLGGGWKQQTHLSLQYCLSMTVSVQDKMERNHSKKVFKLCITKINFPSTIIIKQWMQYRGSAGTLATSSLIATHLGSCLEKGWRFPLRFAFSTGRPRRSSIVWYLLLVNRGAFKNHIVVARLQTTINSLSETPSRSLCIYFADSSGNTVPLK
jgi:hypothetical protein